MARNLSPEQIPPGWTYQLLDKVTERCSGHTPSKSIPEYWNGGIKWISLADTFRLDNGYVYETEKEISHEGIKNSSAQLHPAETVVLSRDAGIGKSGVMAEPMAVSQHFIAWKCDNQEKMNSWFLYNWLQLYKAEFERQAVGSTIKTIGLPFFKKLKVVVPPYEEQSKIAKILTTWDKAISTTERLIDNSKQQKKALMQQLLTGKKRFSIYSENWLSDSLENIVGKIYGGGTPSRNEPRYWSGKIPWVTVKDLVSDRISGAQEHITESGLSNSSANIVPAGTVIIATRMALGKAVISECDVAINQDLKAICNSDKVTSSFLHYWFILHSDQIERMGTGSTVKGIQLEIIKSLKMTLPRSLEEQDKIASVLINADNEIELLEQQLADLKQEKKALMQQLLKGKRRVKIDDKEVA
jgi:type I restriction enzyme S subunit